MLDYRSIALKVGDALKGSTDSGIIATKAPWIFPFKLEHFPDPAVTTKVGGLIYDWIMTLARNEPDPDQRDYLLYTFCREIAPPKKKAEIRAVIFDGLSPEQIRRIERSFREIGLQRRIRNIWVSRRQFRRVKVFLITIPFFIALFIASVTVLAKANVSVWLVEAVGFLELAAWIAFGLTYGNVPFNRDKRSKKYFPIEKFVGKLFYGQRSYEAFPLDSDHSLLPVNLEPQLPGYRYRFQFVQEPQLLISMTPAGGQREEVLEGLNSGLAQTLGYPLADLPTNRKGRLSSRQKISVLGHALGRARLWFFILGLASGIAIQYFLAEGFLNALGSDARPFFSCLCTGINLVVYSAAFVRAVMPQLRSKTSIPLSALSVLLVDLLVGKVECIEGEGLRNEGIYAIGVAGMGYFVTPKVHAAFCNHVIYRAFFTPLSRELVSLEALEVELPPHTPAISLEEWPHKPMRF